MGRGKRKSARKRSLCIVCENLYQFSSSSIVRCSSHHTSSHHNICDGCLYRHIFTAVSKDITDRVICPIQGCDAKISNDIIQSILVQFNPGLSEEYKLKSNWHGGTKQWIKRFTARCPNCCVPIEKNGGCNQVQCSRCHKSFNWQLAKDSKLYQVSTRWRILMSPIRAFFYRLIICSTLLVILFLFLKEKFMLLIHNFLTKLTRLANMFPIILFK